MGERALVLFEPRCEETGLRDFQKGMTQTRLYNNRRWLETWNFRFRKESDCTICVAKTKALISFAVTAKLICAFVFAYAKSRFSHDMAHFSFNKSISFMKSGYLYTAFFKPVQSRVYKLI